jgi:hypothetical protein
MRNPANLSRYAAALVLVACTATVSRAAGPAADRRVVEAAQAKNWTAVASLVRQKANLNDRSPTARRHFSGLRTGTRSTP